MTIHRLAHALAAAAVLLAAPALAAGDAPDERADPPGPAAAADAAAEALALPRRVEASQSLQRSCLERKQAGELTKPEIRQGAHMNIWPTDACQINFNATRPWRRCGRVWVDVLDTHGNNPIAQVSLRCWNDTDYEDLLTYLSDSDRSYLCRKRVGC